MDFICQTLKTHREIIAYGIAGCISVADSVFWFWFFVTPLAMPYMYANALGWFIDVWIVFVMNKYFVFQSKDAGSFWHEAWMFISARLASGVLDMIILWALLDVLHVGVMWAKGIDIVIIIIVNYVAAKLFVFCK